MLDIQVFLPSPQTAFAAIFAVLLCKSSVREKIKIALLFSWACFVKPLFVKIKRDPNANQQDLLEQFYLNQASIYDETRSILLKGRVECLRLAISHLPKKKGLVWIDIGGGTGANIDKMDSIVPISNFDAVYLIDLSPSLCEVARKRFAAKNWTNVHVEVGDASYFEINHEKADLITFSYSLSMIPTFNGAIDHASKLLDPNGVIAAVDFGFQTNDSSMGRINTLGGLVNRNIPWILRNFWRIWFEADKVYLDPARRTYLEYKFGTIKSLNSFNSKLGKIPYYIWIGCDKAKSTALIDKINCFATESPYLAPKKLKNFEELPVSKGHEAALSNIKRNLPYPSIYYQTENWRVYYDETLPVYDQFSNQYIYAFTWEDPAEDNKILKFTSEDTVLAITSAGDNILSYASLPQPPKRIHSVDLNPCQNHLLELKLAAFRCLSREQIWSMFGEGKIDNFQDILYNKLSSHMSSNAFQYWAGPASKTFDLNRKGLYDTGSTRWALRLAGGVFKILGLQKSVQELCSCYTIKQQKKIWQEKIRPALFNNIVGHLLVGNPIFLWKALGVPANQASMMGDSILQYVIDTLEPLIDRSLISRDNYFYYLCLMGQYAPDNCPDYLTEKGYMRLKSNNKDAEDSPLNNIRMHTDSLNDVFARLRQKSITIAIVMDHMDWFDPNGLDARNEILALKSCLADEARVMLRSAGSHPWYLKLFEELGFKCEPAGIRKSGNSIDRVNMYASTWVCTKLPEKSSERMGSLTI